MMFAMLSILGADGNPHVRIEGPGAEMLVHRIKQLAGRGQE